MIDISSRVAYVLRGHFLYFCENTISSLYFGVSPICTNQKCPLKNVSYPFLCPKPGVFSQRKTPQTVRKGCELRERGANGEKGVHLKHRLWISCPCLLPSSIPTLSEGIPIPDIWQNLSQPVFSPDQWKWWGRGRAPWGRLALPANPFYGNKTTVGLRKANGSPIVHK